MPLCELPREHISELTYERFLREYALPRQPLIIEGVGADWPAASSWRELDYFLSHAAVDREHEVSVNEGGPGVAERDCTVGDALRELRQREADGESRGRPLYLSAWEYVRGGSSALQDDFCVPSLFDRSPRWLAEHSVLGCAATDMKWLYIGEAGTGSATHVDTNMTSAWLWVARGQKEWVCAHGADYDALRAAATVHEAGDEFGARFPDLFAAVDTGGSPHAALARARLYHGHQRAGEAPTVSLTHNYIDASNLPDVMADAHRIPLERPSAWRRRPSPPARPAATVAPGGSPHSRGATEPVGVLSATLVPPRSWAVLGACYARLRSLEEELLPMATALGPKKVLKLLAKSLHVKSGALRGTLRALPSLLHGDALGQVLGAASAAEASPEEVEAAEQHVTHVEALLRPPLEAMRAELLPRFEATAARLVEALELSKDKGAKGAEADG